MVILYGQGEYEGIDDALFRERNKYARAPQDINLTLTERGGWGHKWGDPRPLYGNPDDFQEHKLRRQWKPAPGETYALGDVKPYRGFDSVLSDPKTAYFMQANKVRADAGPQWTNYTDFNKKDYPKSLKYKDQRRDWGLLRHQAATVAQNRSVMQLYGGEGPVGAYHNPPTPDQPSMTYSPGALGPRAFQTTQRSQTQGGLNALVPYTGGASYDDFGGGYGYGGYGQHGGYGGYGGYGYGGYGQHGGYGGYGGYGDYGNYGYGMPQSFGVAAGAYAPGYAAAPMAPGGFGGAYPMFF